MFHIKNPIYIGKWKGSTFLENKVLNKRTNSSFQWHDTVTLLEKNGIKKIICQYLDKTNEINFKLNLIISGTG